MDRKNYSGAMGMCIGLSIGVTVGVLTGNLGLWMPLGLCFGVMAGSLFFKNGTDDDRGHKGDQ